MPELPEVQTIVSDLKKYLEGAEIKNVAIHQPYKTIPDNKTFMAGVVGQKITNITRQAKNIVFDLANGKTIIIHLAMTGRILLRTKGFKQDSWERVIFTVEKNEKVLEMRFCDMRTFGKVALVENRNDYFEGKYGPEPIDKKLTPQQFLTILKSKKTNIKNVLLDQEFVSGLGNIYATDALFLAGINPETTTADLSPENASTLLETARLILAEGIEHRGSTLGDKMYVDIFGKEGVHQKFFRIYGKETCPNCSSTVAFTKLNGRGTYYCPKCQPKKGQAGLL